MIGFTNCLILAVSAITGNCFKGVTLNNIVSSNILMYSLRQKFISNIICSDKMMNHFEHPCHVVPADVFYVTLFAGSIILYINDENWKNKYQKLQKSMGVSSSVANRYLESFVIVSSLIIAKDVNICI